MRAPKPPALQVLFEPFPDHADYRWDREGGEAFAGTYYLDALEPDGSLKVRGYRAMFVGCSGCRRSDTDPRAHWDMRNDSKRPGDKVRHCGKWKMIGSVVKAFGGWKAAHYVELAEYEGLKYQPIPQRRRDVASCEACGGTGLGKCNDDDGMTLQRMPGRLYPSCNAPGCGSGTYGGRGEVRQVYEGPVRPDRHGMTATQLRKR